MPTLTREQALLWVRDCIRYSRWVSIYSRYTITDPLQLTRQLRVNACKPVLRKLYNFIFILSISSPVSMTLFCVLPR